MGGTRKGEAGKRGVITMSGGRGGEEGGREETTGGGETTAGGTSVERTGVVDG